MDYATADVPSTENTTPFGNCDDMVLPCYRRRRAWHWQEIRPDLALSRVVLSRFVDARLSEDSMLDSFRFECLGKLEMGILSPDLRYPADSR